MDYRHRRSQEDERQDQRRQDRRLSALRLPARVSHRPDAADADFRLAVIKDCCADLNSQVHDCLINKFFPSRESVLSAREFVEAS